MARITVFMTLSDEDIAVGWDSSDAELAESVSAALFELIGDDGGAYRPDVLNVEVDHD